MPVFPNEFARRQDAAEGTANGAAPNESRLLSTDLDPVAGLALVDAAGRVAAADAMWQQLMLAMPPLCSPCPVGTPLRTLLEAVGGEAGDLAQSYVQALDRAGSGEGSGCELLLSWQCGDEPRWHRVRMAPLQGEDAGCAGLVAITHWDVTAQQRAERMAACQRHVLELIAADAPLEQSLSALALEVEALAPGLLCSILLVDEAGRSLRHGAAPSLSEAYRRAIDGCPIGPRRGTCGTAAFLGRPVISESIATDPAWVESREAAQAEGLEACASMPVFDSRRAVIGTFAVYYRSPRGLGELHRRLLEEAARLAAVAIESKRVERRFRHLASFPELNPNPITEITLSGQLQYANPCAERVLPGLHAQGMEHRWFAPLRECLESRPVAEAKPLLPDTLEVCIGERCFLQTLHWLEDSRTLRTYGIDISDRKRAEARLLASQRRLLEQQAALAALTRFETRMCGDLQAALRRLTEAAARCEMVERVNVWLYAPDRSSIRCIDQYALGSGLHSEGEVLMVADYPAYFVALEREEAIVADDARSHPATFEFAAGYLARHDIRSLLDAPIRSAGRVLGVLCYEQVGKPVHWSTEQRLFAIALANLVALLLEQEERRRAQEALRESERRLATLIEYAPDVITILDVETGRWIDVNENAARLFGLPKARLLELGPLDLSPPQQPDGRSSRLLAAEKYAQALAGGAPVFQWTHLDATGRALTCEVRLIRLPDARRRLLRQSVVDISERLRVERELRQAKEAAEAANRAKTEFLASMSHELRTPLNSVLGYAQLLQRQTDLSAEQGKALAIIQRSGEHLLGLIEDVLDMAKIEAGSLQLHPAPMDLHDLLRGTAAILRSRAERKGLKFTADWPASLPRCVLGDARRLRQVLMNLLENAVKYTDQGGLLLAVSQHERQFRFLVEDTGIGIHAEHQSRICEVFYRVENLRRGAGGTGLGLAISRTLVALMGGELRVSSTPGEGTRFWFDLDLPVVLDPVPTVGATAGSALDVRIGRAHRILVVDDQDDSRSLIRDLLSPLGFEVIEACDGLEGYEQACRTKPHAILLDIRVPGIDGLQATRLIRATAGLEDAVVIAVSASAFEQDRADCFEAGVDEFLAKPFRVDRLLERLLCLLGLVAVDTTAEPATAAASSNAWVVPAPEHLCPLLEADRRGDVARLKREADDLVMVDARYAAFADRVRELVDGFQLRRLREWLEALDRGSGE